MNTILLPREILENIYYKDKYIELINTGEARWESYHEMIFKHEDKFYSAPYRKGLTEMQETSPFDDTHPDEIECTEVKPVKKEIIVYEPVDTGI